MILEKRMYRLQDKKWDALDSLFSWSSAGCIFSNLLCSFWCYYFFTLSPYCFLYILKYKKINEANLVILLAVDALNQKGPTGQSLFSVVWENVAQ